MGEYNLKITVKAALLFRPSNMIPSDSFSYDVDNDNDTIMQNVNDGTSVYSI